MAKAKKILVKVRAANAVPLDSLLAFQGEIKTLSKEEYERLRTTTIKEGIRLALHVWEHKGQLNLIDGHQRTWAWKKMRDDEGFEFDDIPVSYVEAETIEEAKRVVLLALSQSGKVNQESLANYIRENHISVEWVVASLNPPNIKMGDFAERFLNIKAPPMPTLPPSAEGPTKMASSSGQVKQVQLFFTTDDMTEFNNMINELAAKYDTANITDTVMEAVRAAYKTLK